MTITGLALAKFATSLYHKIRLIINIIIDKNNYDVINIIKNIAFILLTRKIHSISFIFKLFLSLLLTRTNHKSQSIIKLFLASFLYHLWQSYHNHNTRRWQGP